VNGKLVGKFEYHLEAYEGIESMLSNLKDYEKWILSGDKTAKPEDWNSWIPENQQVYGASPQEKLERIATAR
jgi:exonuclease III